MEKFNITPIENNGERVLTTAQLAESYKTTAKTITNNFSNNKSRYTEGKHFYCLTGEELRMFKSETENLGFALNLNKLYLWTEKGALLHAKSLNTDKAWEVYDFLIENYFQKKAPDYSALSSYPRSEQVISGASIRLAEELARCWGNLDYGIKELSQKEGESEMMAYCWDMENNLISSQTFVVEHTRDTRSGKKKLLTQRDIYENNANMAGRRLRARILAVLPPDLVEAAIDACRQTLTGNQEKATPQQIAETKEAFARLGVNLAAIENRIGHSLNDLTMQELNDFYGIHSSIIDGHSNIFDWFDVKTNNGRAKSLTDKIMNGNHQDGEQLMMTATE